MSTDIHTDTDTDDDRDRLEERVDELEAELKQLRNGDAAPAAQSGSSRRSFLGALAGIAGAGAYGSYSLGKAAADPADATGTVYYDQIGDAENPVSQLYVDEEVTYNDVEEFSNLSVTDQADVSSLSTERAGIKYQPIIDATEYEGDDLGEQINNALSELGTDPGTIIIPGQSSSYTLSTPVTGISDRQHIVGWNGVPIIDSDIVGDWMFSTAAGSKNIQISNLRIYGSGSENGAFYLDNLKRTCKIENVTTDRVGGSTVQIDDGFNVILENCWLTNFEDYGIEAVNAANEILLRDVTITANQSGISTSSCVGIKLIDGARYNLHHIGVENCDIGLELSADAENLNDVTIDDPFIENNDIGIKAHSPSGNMDIFELNIEGGSVIRNDTEDFDLDDCRRFVVDNPQIDSGLIQSGCLAGTVRQPKNRWGRWDDSGDTLFIGPTDSGVFETSSLRVVESGNASVSSNSSETVVSQYDNDGTLFGSAHLNGTSGSSTPSVIGGNSDYVIKIAPEGDGSGVNVEIENQTDFSANLEYTIFEWVA